ncbi:MAG TPA: diguanylate cyclase [Burkholderiales bacterium]|nr:diguanylate cyclase [Burkholderiales bacterium]
MSKILIVDDSETIRAVLALTVQAMKFEPVLADCGERALELFVAERPSLVLLDVNMPGIDGYETARRIRAVRQEEWIPIIFLSASEDDQDLKRAIECGGDDYLVKPVSTVVLNAKMRALQRLDQMRRKLIEVSNELTAANQRLETLSHQDGLTGIANRRAFDFLIERQFVEAQRRREPFAVVLCDVDHFKAYNDQYGHLAGDECLRQVAAALARSCKRATDVAARYGGEEFALLLPDTPAAGALRVVEIAQTELAALAITHAGSTTSNVVTFSAGIASYLPERDKVSRDLAARADEALYRAKQLGRNRAVAV